MTSRHSPGAVSAFQSKLKEQPQVAGTPSSNTEAERNFDSRQYFYQKELQQFKEYLAGRETSVTRTEFDGHLFVEINQLARNLIEAEGSTKIVRTDAPHAGRMAT